MSDTRNLSQLQARGKALRDNTEQQIEWLLERKHRDEAYMYSSEILIAFERKFFLPRKQAMKTINSIYE